MSIRVQLSFGERFLNWFRKHTKLYIRGERGSDHDVVDALDYELAGQLNAWIVTQREGYAIATQQAIARLTDKWLCEAVNLPAGDPCERTIVAMVAEVRALLPDSTRYDNG